MVRAGPAIEWRTVDLLIFDMDGTLYRQRPMRLLMLAELLAATARTRNLSLFSTLRHYRHAHELTAQSASADPHCAQLRLAAERTGRSEEEIAALADEWMHRRPLAHLPRCKVPGVDALFAAITRSGRKVAILSDYPATAKLAALGLSASWIQRAGEGEVCPRKPDPAGLRRILSKADVPAGRAVMIGDRADRDVEAARRVGMRAVLRSSRRFQDIPTFRTFADPLFADLLEGASPPAPAGAALTARGITPQVSTTS